MATIFDNILLRGVKSGQIPARTQQARTWFRETAETTRSSAGRPNSILRDGEKTAIVRPGRMYHFFYDPKTKQTLPYYDVFPLIFMVKKTQDGFYGINLHYLPLPLRAKLMDALYNIASDDRYDQNTKLRLSYSILSKSAKYRYFKPCFKHYLGDHVSSRFIEIPSSQWDIALFLPTERFKKSTKSTIWTQSRQQI